MVSIRHIALPDAYNHPLVAVIRQSAYAQARRGSVQHFSRHPAGPAAPRVRACHPARPAARRRAGRTVWTDTAAGGELAQGLLQHYNAASRYRSYAITEPNHARAPAK